MLCLNPLLIDGRKDRHRLQKARPNEIETDEMIKQTKLVKKQIASIMKVPSFCEEDTQSPAKTKKGSCYSSYGWCVALNAPKGGAWECSSRRK